jgi:hypothetical protein
MIVVIVQWGASVTHQQTIAGINISAHQKKALISFLKRSLLFLVMVRVMVMVTVMVLVVETCHHPLIRPQRGAGRVAKLDQAKAY